MVIYSWDEEAISSDHGDFVVFARADYLEKIEGLQSFVLLHYHAYLRKLRQTKGKPLRAKPTAPF